MKIILIKKNLLVLYLALILSACGFHLRGSYVLPSWFNQVYVSGLQNVNNNFSNLLAQRLRANNIQVVSQPEQARSILNLLQDDLSRSIFATNPATGVASSYQVRYRLKYEAYPVSGGGKVSGEFYQTENYDFDSNDLLGASEKEQEIRNTLLNDAVNSIFTHLARKK